MRPPSSAALRWPAVYRASDAEAWGVPWAGRSLSKRRSRRGGDDGCAGSRDGSRAKVGHRRSSPPLEVRYHRTAAEVANRIAAAGGGVKGFTEVFGVPWVIGWGRVRAWREDDWDPIEAPGQQTFEWAS